MKIKFIMIFTLVTSISYIAINPSSNENSPDAIVVDNSKNDEIVLYEDQSSQSTILDQETSYSESLSTSDIKTNIDLDTDDYIDIESNIDNSAEEWRHNQWHNNYADSYSEPESKSLTESTDDTNRDTESAAYTYSNNSAASTRQGNPDSLDTPQPVYQNVVNNSGADPVYTDDSNEVIENKPQIYCPKTLYMGGNSYAISMLKKSGCPKPDNYIGPW